MSEGTSREREISCPVQTEPLLRCPTGTTGELYGGVGRGGVGSDTQVVVGTRGTNVCLTSFVPSLPCNVQTPLRRCSPRCTHLVSCLPFVSHSLPLYLPSVVGCTLCPSLPPFYHLGSIQTGLRNSPERTLPRIGPAGDPPRTRTTREPRHSGRATVPEEVSRRDRSLEYWWSTTEGDRLQKPYLACANKR